MDQPKKYKLIKTYPGFENIGMIVTKNGNGIYTYTKNEMIWYMATGIVENCPIYWKEIKPLVLALPLEVYYTTSILKKKLFRVCRTEKLEDEVYVICSYNNGGNTTKMTVERFNTLIEISKERGNLQVFDTLEEANEEILYNVPLLSINDINEIYLSAKNPKYEQSERLLNLVKQKL